MTHLRIRKFNTKETYPEQKLDNDLSQAVVAKGTNVFLRGQVSQDLETRETLYVGDPKLQTRKTMENIDLLLNSLVGASGMEPTLKAIENGVDVIVAAISSIGIKWFAEEVSKYYKKKLPIVLLTKGLSVENDELITLSEKIKILLKEKGHNDNEINISAIKGPCLATGLANKMRTGTVIANPDIKAAQFLKKIISTNYYSTELSNDLQGVELSGAIKNIYSMLIGAAEGLSNSKAPIEIQSKYYLNTSASLIHRSISEMAEFVSCYGGTTETVYGLAGLGDLYVSAIGCLLYTSPSPRDQRGWRNPGSS